MRVFAVIFLTSVLTDNFVLNRFLGICPFLGVSQKIKTAAGMSTAVIFVMVLSTAVTYPINRFLLVPNGLDYLQTVVFILVIAALVQLVEIVLKKYMKPLYKALGVYLPLITTNCVVLGVVLLNVESEAGWLAQLGSSGFLNGFSLSIVNSLGAGIGFFLAMVIFAGVRRHLERCDIPKFLRGLPITLIAASFVSLSFMGFTGIIERVFGG